MRFAAPLAFLTLLLVPLGWWLLRRLERLRAARLGAAGELGLLERMGRLDETGSAGRRGQLGGLVLASLALIAIAFARPQFGARTEVQKARGMDLVVALDLSRSMLAQDVAPSRLGRARIELEALLRELRGDRVGLVGFTSVALPLCPLTVDHAALSLQLEQANPDALPRGGTAIADAIDVSREMLERSPYKTSGKAIVVITDGEEHEGDPEAAARKAQEAGIVVHMVGVGSSSGEPIPLAGGGYVRDAVGQTVISRLDRAMLEKIAAAGGGVVAAPAEGGGFDLSALRASLSQLDKAEFESRSTRVYEERYRWALVPAFLLLLLATLIPATVRRAGALAVLCATLGLASSAEARPWKRTQPDVEAGNEALRAGKAQEALDAYARAEKALGPVPELKLNRALAEIALGKTEDAAGALKEAMQSPDPAVRAEAAFALGNLERAAKKYDDALKAYRKSLLADPGHSGARRNLELTQALKRIVAAQQNQEKPKEGQTPPPPQDRDGGASADGGDSDGGGGDGGQNDASPGDGQQNPGQDESQDAGPPDGSSSGQDGGGPPDGGSASGAESPDAGGRGQDAGAPPSTPNPSTPPEPPSKDKERILDALEAREKTLKAERRMKKLPPRNVEKDW